MTTTLPHVAVLSLGGTIATTSRGNRGALPHVTPEEILAALPEHIAEFNLSSIDISFAHSSKYILLHKGTRIEAESPQLKVLCKAFVARTCSGEP